MNDEHSTQAGDARPAGEANEAWPDPLNEKALHGLAGDIVRTVGPHTESDPVALLGQFLVMFGNVIGRTALFPVEEDQHCGNLFCCLFGTTAKARKGTGYGRVSGLFRDVDADWLSKRVKTGLSSGEGLIYHVRDPIDEPQAIQDSSGRGKKKRDEGVADKRLLIVEQEFGGVLSCIAREKNTLAAVMRDGWDGRPLGGLTRNNPMTATGAHISIIAHITREELLKRLSETDIANGLVNRFLLLAVQRSKCLPEGGELHRVDLSPLVERLRAAVEHGRRQHQMRRDDDAREIWREVYPTLSEGKPGLFGKATSRAEAQTVRLALLYALLDCSPVIRAEHLTAALAFWRYAEQSARFIFGDALGNRTADVIKSELRRRSPSRATRTEISRFFQGNKTAEAIDRALALLSDAGLAQRELLGNGAGRKAEAWFAVR